MRRPARKRRTPEPHAGTWIPGDTIESVRRDAAKRCGICKGLGWHWGWWRETGEPLRLRCPCVDQTRARSAANGGPTTPSGQGA